MSIRRIFSRKTGEDYFYEGLQLKYEENYRKALVKFRRAAEDFEHTDAQITIGDMYEMGDEIPVDREQALLWYKRAADNGNERAQYIVGGCYRHGRCGVEVDYKEAIRHYQMAANQGHNLAQFCLGEMYQYGYGVVVDQKEAFNWYQKAAKSNAEAMYKVGHAYQNGLGVAKNADQALKWYLESADEHYEMAQFRLGIAYMNGFGVAQDFQAAFYWFSLSESLSYSKLCLGYLFENGLGVNQDIEKAKRYFDTHPQDDRVKIEYELGMYYLEIEEGRTKTEQSLYWLEKAATENHIHALVAIAGIHLMGGKEYEKAFSYLSSAAKLEGVQLTLDQIKPIQDLSAKQGYGHIMKWYTKSLDNGKIVGKGCISGLSCIGYLYQQGIGVRQDFLRARELYLRVLHYIDDNDSDANMCIGLMYLNGSGVDQNYEMAVRHFERSAKSMNTYTYNNIGDAYKFGNGVEQNHIKAMEWYMKGAKYDDGYSQLNIGKMYFYGLGVTADKDVAMIWFQKSFNNGCKEAQNFISHISSSHSDTNLNSPAKTDEVHLTTDQLLANERIAREASEEKVRQLMAQLALANVEAKNLSDMDSPVPTSPATQSSFLTESDSTYSTESQRLQFFHLDHPSLEENDLQANGNKRALNGRAVKILSTNSERSSIIANLPDKKVKEPLQFFHLEDYSSVQSRS